MTVHFTTLSAGGRGAVSWVSRQSITFIIPYSLPLPFKRMGNPSKSSLFWTLWMFPLKTLFQDSHSLSWQERCQWKYQLELANPLQGLTLLFQVPALPSSSPNLWISLRYIWSSFGAVWPHTPVAEHTWSKVVMCHSKTVSVSVRCGHSVSYWNTFDKGSPSWSDVGERRLEEWTGLDSFSFWQPIYRWSQNLGITYAVLLQGTDHKASPCSSCIEFE